MENAVGFSVVREIHPWFRSQEGNGGNSERKIGEKHTSSEL